MLAAQQGQAARRVHDGSRPGHLDHVLRRRCRERPAGSDANPSRYARAGHSPEALTSDLEALQRGLVLRGKEFQDAIEATTQQIARNQGAPSDQTGDLSRIEQTLTEITRDVQGLQAELQAETFRRDTLTTDLTTARNNFSTILTKVNEADVSQATNRGAATVAAVASDPTSRSFPPSIARASLLGAVAGLLLGLAIATLADVWPRRPAINPADTRVRVAVGSD